MSDLPGGYATVRKLLLATMDELSNGERKVARALLAAYPTIGLTTAADLAAAAGVSAPTVVRFVTRLGFSGFPHFQRALVHELHGELGSPLKQFDAKAGSVGNGILRTMQQSFAEMVESTYSELPESEFRRIVTLLCDPHKQVLVAGGRFSSVLAEYLVLHLHLLRPDVHVVGSNDIDQRAAVADAGSGTVFVIFDYRRYTESNQRFAEAIARRGATVCLMTDNWLSPIAKSAKIVLPTRVESASPFDSLVAALIVTESIVAAVADRLGEKGRERLELFEGIEPS